MSVDIKQEVLRILQQVPETRNSDRVLRKVFYWQCYPKYNQVINGKLWRDDEVEKIVDPETIRRTRQKIQEHAKKMVKEGEVKWQNVLSDKQVAKAREEKEKKIAKAFGGNIVDVL